MANEPPKGAIKVADDLWMVPLGRDETGCPTYSAWSGTRATLTVVYYRAAAGGFTTDRSEADCNGG